MTEAVCAGASLTQVDGAQGEGETPRTAGAGPLQLHGAGAELAVAGGQHAEAGAGLGVLCDVQADGQLSGLGQGRRVETAVTELTLVARTDGEGLE